KLRLLLESRERIAGAKGAIDVDLFAEEAGKRALTVLNPPKSGAGSGVAPGEVREPHRQDGGLKAQTIAAVVLGDVDSKIARRLVPLISTGNRYTAVVARVEESQIEIIIREAFQSNENARKSSFPVSRQRREEFRPYAKDSLLAQRGTDEQALGDAGEEEEVGDAGEPAEELGPLAAGEDVEAEDDVDEDVRPEDQY